MAAVAPHQNLKEEGNNYFKNKKYKEAVASYNKALQVIEDRHSPDASVLHSNMAACYLSLQEYAKCVEACTASLSITPNNTKAFYRRSLAEEQLKKYEEAVRDMREVLRNEPNNKEAMAALPRMVKSLENSLAGSGIRTFIDKLVEAKTAAEQEKAAEGTLAVLQDQDQGIELVKAGGLDVFKSLLIQDTSKVLSPRVRSLLLKCLASISHVDRCCTKILDTFAPSYFLGLMTDPDTELRKIAISIFCRASVALFKEHPQSEEFNGLVVETISAMAVDESQPLDVIRHSLMSMARLPWQAKQGVQFLRQGHVYSFLKLAATRFSDDFSLVSVVLARAFDAIQQGQEAKSEIVPKSAQFVREHLKGDDLSDQIQAVVALLCLLMADNATGVAVLMQDLLSVLTNLTSFPKDSNPNDQRKLLLLTTEIFAYASDHEEFQKMHSLPMEELEDLFKQMNTPDKPVQARVVNALGKLANASAEVRSYLMKDKAARALKITVSLLDYDDKNEGFVREYGEARSTKQWAVETLSFLTRIPEVKEQLVNQYESSLPLLLSFTSNPNAKEKKMSFADFAVATVLYNLTYDPFMGMSKTDTELQEELDKLKKFAGEKARGKPHELDGKTYVENRCKKVVEHGATTALIHVAKDISRLTDAMCDVLSHVFLNLTNIVANRGRIVKDGGLKVLVALSQNGTEKGKAAAAHALAKIAITTNPHVAFKNGVEFSIIKAVMPLTRTDIPLRQFEALLALTNLADMSEETRAAIARDKDDSGLEWIEGLMLEEDVQIRRAACELCCNLLYCGYVSDIYHNPDRAPRRLKIWGIFAQSEDYATQRACGGALATLASDPDVAKFFDGQVDPVIFLDFVTSGKEELEHRAVVALEGLSIIPAYAKRLQETGIVPPLRKLVNSSNPAISKSAANALQNLQAPASS